MPGSMETEWLKQRASATSSRLEGGDRSRLTSTEAGECTLCLMAVNGIEGSKLGDRSEESSRV